MSQTDNLQEMFHELTRYEKQKVNLGIDGVPASPMQIVQAHMMREDVVYMRDYVWDEEGDIKELWFHSVEL